MNAQESDAECQVTVKSCAELLQRIRPMALRYEENLKERQNVDIGLNLFELISDHYYRETFHSDILHALLDPKGKNKDQKKHLLRFLEFIHGCGANINVSDYLHDVEVEKEEGKIDLLIQGSGKAIIIENKINGAPDMPQQIPRYLDYVRKRGCSCDAIIYLRLNSDANPDTTGWTHEQTKEVEEKILVIRAYDHSEWNLLNGWITKCENESENFDSKYVLRQYGGIIKKLGVNIMNKPIMEEFYQSVVKDDKAYRTALSLRKMLDEHRDHGASRIVDRFVLKNEFHPFYKPFRQDNGAIFRHAAFGGADFQMAVWVIPYTSLPDTYLLEFRDLKNNARIERHAESIIKEMGYLGEYEPSNEGGYFSMRRRFAFPSQEEDLVKHLSEFIHKLREIVCVQPDPLRILPTQIQP